MPNSVEMDLSWNGSFRCSPDWHSSNANMGYLTFILTLGFFAPIVTILFTSVITCTKIRRVRRTVCGETRRRSLKRNRIALTLVLAMNICFLLCWTPYGVVSMLIMFSDDANFQRRYFSIILEIIILSRARILLSLEIYGTSKTTFDNDQPRLIFF